MLSVRMIHVASAVVGLLSLGSYSHAGNATSSIFITNEVDVAEASGGTGSASASGSGSGGSASASILEILDATNAGVYRYFGITNIASSSNDSRIETTSSVLFNGLSQVAYIITQTASVTGSGSGGASASISLNSPSSVGFAQTYSTSSGGNTTNGSPAGFINGVASLRAITSPSGGSPSPGQGAADVTAILSLFEIDTTGTLGTAGDVNNDGVVSLPDLDTVTQGISASITPTTFGQQTFDSFDYDGNGLLTSADIDALLSGEFATVRGDANLDGKVDSSDLAIIASNFGTFGGWGQGDFNGDFTINTSDFAILSSNFGFGTAPLSSAVAAVPEPGVLTLLGLAGVATLVRRRA